MLTTEIRTDPNLDDQDLGHLAQRVSRDAWVDLLSPEDEDL